MTITTHIPTVIRDDKWSIRRSLLFIVASSVALWAVIGLVVWGVMG